MTDVKSTETWLEEQKNRMKQNLAANIYERRKQLGLTQQEVADRACLSIETVGKLETQKQWFSMDSLLLICRALELSPSQLFLDREYENAVPLAELWSYLDEYSPKNKAEGNPWHSPYSIKNSSRRK